MLPPMTAINTHEGTAPRSVHATERGSATRQHILAVATEEFLAHGYACTSLSDLIRVAGVTKGGFYHHFPSKEALAVEVVRTRQAEWAARVVQASARHDRAVDQLRAMAQVASDLKEQDRDKDHSTSLQRLGAEQQCVMTASHEDFRGEFRALMTRCLDLLLDVFKPVAEQRG